MTVATIPIPPPEGFTIDELAGLELPPRTQLIRGGLYVNAAARTWHNLVVLGLCFELRAVATDAVVIQDMAVRLDSHHAPEPDILVIERRAYREDANSYPPEVVILAVEVMSSDQRKDRVVRPDEYALAGIPHYWRIERTPERAFVGYTYELDPVNLKFTQTGVHHGRLATSQPWPLDVDLPALARP